MDIPESDCLELPDLAWYELMDCSAWSMILFDIVVFLLIKLLEEMLHFQAKRIIYPCLKSRQLVRT